ncbi:M4 family metallopeptidase [Marisediminicola sp. LYQ134]|uniref:M4 family metallopeptidase n=1 Tax=Marisediminicola sp. LYQ134 TaxID=3391061 RepID=UPI003983BE58
MRRFIVPPYLLVHLSGLRASGLDDPTLARAIDAARHSLAIDTPFRETRESPEGGRAPRPGARSPGAERPDRTISDAQNAETLPGVVVRREGDSETDDVAVTEAYDGFGHTHALFADVFGRASIDDAGFPLDGTVHFGRDYDNAFWDGERMVFGDGDGIVFRRFTASLSVIGHELAHGVIEFTAGLIYRGQSGALNESIADVFGALVEQRVLGQDADEASWLIGAGLFTDRVQGAALRSMSAPGTAFDDDVLGTDPQPASMDDYIDTTDDNGGVHLNSGIPNRAFHLAATAIGGPAWEGAGRIWYDTLTAGSIRADCTFAQFASATTDAAGSRFGSGSAEHTAVTAAWRTVGVVAGTDA